MPLIVPQLPEPLVPVHDLKIGQAYIHKVGGIVRTLVSKDDSLINIMRHDALEKSQWIPNRLTPDMPGWSMMVSVVPTPMKIKAADVAQIQMF